MHEKIGFRQPDVPGGHSIQLQHSTITLCIAQNQHCCIRARQTLAVAGRPGIDDIPRVARAGCVNGVLKSRAAHVVAEECQPQSPNCSCRSENIRMAALVRAVQWNPYWGFLWYCPAVIAAWGLGWLVERHVSAPAMRLLLGNLHQKSDECSVSPECPGSDAVSQVTCFKCRPR